jgi:3-oxoacyl-[acyl-carrier-protein] synthase-1
MVSEALRAGHSGVSVDPERVKRGFRSPLTGMIRNFNPADYLSRKQLKSMPDFAAWAYAATMDALSQSGLTTDDISNDETGLVFGCDSSGLTAVEQIERLEQAGETKSIGSGYVFRSMTSTVTMNLNTLLQTRGACWSIASACSSGGHAVGQAADLIALGRQQRVICGAAQEINWQTMCSFDGLGAFSTRVDTPTAACRPFDSARDGLVPSGGAAALILERYDLARARGARVLGEVMSYGFSSDGMHLSVPSDDGLQRAMCRALANARMSPEEIDYLSAHATSTPAGDASEARSIKSVFGKQMPSISALKSMTGHELWMSGASQVVYSVIMAGDGFIAPSINFVLGDDDTSGLNIVRETLPRSPRNVMCNAAGFGGTNSCLVLHFPS